MGQTYTLYLSNFVTGKNYQLMNTKNVGCSIVETWVAKIMGATGVSVYNYLLSY